MWECSECNQEHDLDPEAEEGQIVECLECGAEFEISTLDPLDLRVLDIAGNAPDDGLASVPYDDDEDDDD